MRVAILQMNAGIDPVRNRETLVTAVQDAAADGAAMLFTPEMSGLLDQDRARSEAALATEDEDETLRAVREAAQASGLWVHLGSLALRDPETGKRFNRGFVIDAAGDIRARYDKIHLFDVDLPSGERWRESSVYQSGHEAVLVQTPWGGIGLTICYDLRFPDLFRALSNAGADIISVPAAFTVPTGEAHWHVLLRARAIESAAFVIASAQCGLHEDGRRTYGHSLVIDPWGTVLLDAGEAPGLYFADLDLDRIAEVRSKIPVLAHRKSIQDVVLS
ncbi:MULTISPECIES: carbon-nitrogen hydrolase family protein [unclassified Sphingobium]|uniref:carbon-nitrogen hydrolase family protein n=1 Tax=unclassified Sphingobium TaxID=2611147 RepID=UPI00222467DD|nr:MULTISPECIES: carbon-nitrogen hydrolase family protein [unclassified Sphingobium]MCW2381860.1 putative amidohydrolase [Sphingobium sp. B2D3B]MCW2398034.1 putative amidohydrolase [Sphingobium sp. B2D3C]